MKIFLLLTLTLSLNAYDLVLNVTNIQEQKGDLYIALEKEKFSSSKDYLASKKITLHAKTLQTTFSNIPDGVYAVSIFHDTNNNGKLDSNFFGVPTEGFGFSNNPKIGFSKPSFEECSFELRNDTNLTIRMEY